RPTTPGTTSSRGRARAARAAPSSSASGRSSSSRSTSIRRSSPRSASTGRAAPTSSSAGARSSSMNAPFDLVPPEFRLEYPNVTDGATLDGDHAWHADAVVVGSGAGGATAAARLREAGLDVLLVEEGGLHRTETFTTDPATMIRRLYRDAGTTMIFGKPGILFAEGKCVGGSTVINGGMTWRTPAPVLERWERELRLDGTGPRAMEPYFAEAERILHPEPNHPDTFGGNTDVFLEGARRLGWPVERAPRNMR